MPIFGNNQHSKWVVVSRLTMTRLLAVGRCPSAPGAVAVALATSFLLPLAATAVPIQAPGSGTASAPATGGTPGMAAGPRRPGAISTVSRSRDTGLNSDIASGTRRPVPGQSEALTAKK
jgi:hypothetical protein